MAEVWSSPLVLPPEIIPPLAILLGMPVMVTGWHPHPRVAVATPGKVAKPARNYLPN